MKKRLKQYLFCLLAGVTYLGIHEGVHLLQAYILDVFEGVRFNGLGVEVLIKEPLAITGWQLACFSGLSSVVTVFIGYIILAATKQILSVNSRFAKVYFYYVAIVFLLLDPLYISVFSFLVGGDINGVAIGLDIPYAAVRTAFLAVLGINSCLVVKKLYPAYIANFNSTVQP